MRFCYMNGEYTEPHKTYIPVTDLAVQRGVGVFETIRTYSRRPMALSMHLERLKESAQRCGISMPLTMEEMNKIIREGLKRFEEDARARPYLTGGDIEMAGQFPKGRFFVFFEPLNPPEERLYKEGIKLLPIDMERPLPHIKSINYLQGYLPLREDPEAAEVLYCPSGEITEASHSNAFMVKGKEIITAPTSRVLAGTMRNMVIEVAKEAGLVVKERCPLMEELPEADEFFITGSVKEVMPVVKVGKTTIGKGRPGPVSQMLRHLYLQNIERWLE